VAVVSGRRLIVLLVVLAAIGAPAIALRAMCVGRSCDTASTSEARVPFCTLPEDLKTAIAAGYREGRSPDVLAVTDALPVTTETEGRHLRVPWPATERPAPSAVPIVFAGTGVDTGASVPDGAGLDQVAPTVAEVLGFERPFPEVRSGTAIPGVAGEGRPSLVLLIAWKGVGGAELEAAPEAWAYLSSLMRGGAGTLAGDPRSLPLDPAATLTTIGTGGLPSQHGITGSLVRNDEGEVVPAFGERAPVQIIATLADDLEEERDGRPLVGLIASDERDRGIVGGGWYPDEDPVDVTIGDGAAVPLAVESYLSSGYGADVEPDVLGVVMAGSIRSLDARTRRIVTAAERETGSVLVVVAGTGGRELRRVAVPSSLVVRQVEEAVPGDRPVVEAVAAGGLFLDQAVLADQGITGQVVVDALLSAETPEGERMMADAFQGFAVSFSRYC
jgi:hypothetical protein